jgi:hypothetical protein
MACHNATGNLMPPFVIFRDSRALAARTVIEMSQSGYINEELLPFTDICSLSLLHDRGSYVDKKDTLSFEGANNILFSNLH